MCMQAGSASRSPRAPASRASSRWAPGRWGTGQLGTGQLGIGRLGFEVMRLGLVSSVFAGTHAREGISARASALR
jgi:hypothetical protein